MADKIALMREGRFVQVGTPSELYDTPVDLQTAAFFSDVNVLYGKVSGGALDTPLGRVRTNGLADGADATLAFRPHAVVLENGTEGSVSGSVTRTRMLGDKGLIEFSVEGLQAPDFTAHVAPSNLPEQGSDIRLKLLEAACFVFEGHQRL